jgi:RND family efflux transporter MFP subunit
MNVEVGTVVDRGQLIAELDATDFELRLEEAGAARLQAEAAARNAQANYERVRGLYEDENASRADLDAARAAAESAQASVQAAVKRIDQAKAQLAYTGLHAPLDGAIAAVTAEVNENVQAGHPVVTLTSSSRPEVATAVPESLIGQVEQGDQVTVTLDALAGRRHTAVVTEVAVASTGVATTFPVTVRLEDAAPEIRPGMTAQVTFTFPATSGGLRFVVPPHAVVEDRQGRFVFVVQPTGEGRGTVRRINVTVGELTQEGLEVLDGLSDGDKVVVAGVSQIHDGLEVRMSLERTDGEEQP